MLAFREQMDDTMKKVGGLGLHNCLGILQVDSRLSEQRTLQVQDATIACCLIAQAVCSLASSTSFSVSVSTFIRTSAFFKAKFPHSHVVIVGMSSLRGSCFRAEPREFELFEPLRRAFAVTH